MTDLLAELDRVWGLVAAYDEWDGFSTEKARRERRAHCAAIALFRRPDFLALIEALREPVGWQVRQIDPDEGPSEWWNTDDHDAQIYRTHASGSYEVRPLYALHTKERDDG